jgi:hypothetical protein
VIDARGLTLIPGLHDLHTHLRSPAFSAPDDLGKAYAGYLLSGVTTANDFSVSGEMLAPIREMTGSGKVAAPNLELAIRLGVPGGHGTEFGWGNFFTMKAATPRAAHVAMAKGAALSPGRDQGVRRWLALWPFAEPEQHGSADAGRDRQGCARGGHPSHHAHGDAGRCARSPRPLVSMRSGTVSAMRWSTMR